VVSNPSSDSTFSSRHEPGKQERPLHGAACSTHSGSSGGKRKKPSPPSVGPSGGAC
jgi:hypothetical protein